MGPVGGALCALTTIGHWKLIIGYLIWVVQGSVR
jgi:hypothetical protein